MALPSKGLRKITVDGETFEYRVSKADTKWRRPEADVVRYMDHPVYIDIYIQSASNPKSICRHTHAFEPEYQDWPSVTPSSVANVIRKAKAQGWKPHEAGNFFWGGDRLDPSALSTNGRTLSPEETADMVRKYNSKFEIRHHK